MDHASEIYGALKEGVHTAGYTFERAMGHLEWILQRDRWKGVGRGFKDVNAFLDSIQIENFRLVAEQRKRIAKLIKELQPTASNRAIAKALGANEKTIRNDAAENSAPEQKNSDEIKEPIMAGAENSAVSGSQAAKLVQRADAKIASAAKAEERREISRNTKPLRDGLDLRIGDCRVVLADVADNSVALVLTDPPYQAESEPLYWWLAEWSARVLVPGGSLICYTGHWSINRDMAIFDRHLRFWWLLAMLHHQSKRLPGKFIIANFKPVLWYVKERRRGSSLVPDVLRPPERQKDDHEWGQGEGGVTDLIGHLTEPGELIADPFAGTGQWGEIAASMGRRWVGADIVCGGSTEIAA
jgi:hypothetical protein